MIAADSGNGSLGVLGALHPMVSPPKCPEIGVSAFSDTDTATNVYIYIYDYMIIYTRLYI